jgi:hypothetical protein
MVFPVVGGTQDTGYEISNSLRFNGGGNAEDVYLTRDYSSAGNQVTWTFSCWVKRTTLGEERPIFAAQAQADLSSGDPIFGLFFHTTDQLRIWTNAGNASIYTNRVFRDVGAWYHIHLKASSSSPYYNLYINGVEETSFNTDNRSSYPGGNDTYVNSGNPHFIGGWRNGSIMSPGMYLANVAIVDGTAHAPTDFAETNDNGVWVPKKPNVSSWGTNGFFLEFKQTGTSANASGIGADTSGQGNHMSVVSLTATDVTTDTPTNNFATLIPALNMQLSEGNTKAVTTRTGNWDGVHSSIGVTKGKWYFETKVSTSGTFRVKSGVVGNPETFTILFNGLGGSGDPLSTLSNTYPAYGKGVWLSHWYDQNYNDSSTASAQSSGDILQFALDMDNYKMWIGVNGQFKDNSNNNVSYSDVASGSSATVTIASAAYTGKTFFPDVWLRDDAGSDDNIAEINFGNPSFSISSGNSDANGYGNFEYAVPSGYYALCTKNLAEYG